MSVKSRILGSYTFVSFPTLVVVKLILKRPFKRCEKTVEGSSGMRGRFVVKEILKQTGSSARSIKSLLSTRQEYCSKHKQI